MLPDSPFFQKPQKLAIRLQAGTRSSGVRHTPVEEKKTIILPRPTLDLASLSHSRTENM